MTIARLSTATSSAIAPAASGHPAAANPIFARLLAAIGAEPSAGLPTGSFPPRPASIGAGPDLERAFGTPPDDPNERADDPTGSSVVTDVLPFLPLPTPSPLADPALRLAGDPDLDLLGIADAAGGGAPALPGDHARPQRGDVPTSPLPTAAPLLSPAGIEAPRTVAPAPGSSVPAPGSGAADGHSRPQGQGLAGATSDLTRPGLDASATTPTPSPEDTTPTRLGPGLGPAPGAPSGAAIEPQAPVVDLPDGLAITERTTAPALARPDVGPAPVDGPSPEVALHRSATAPVATEQVAVQITRASAEQVERVVIQLEPADLGHVEVALEFDPDGGLRARIGVERPETLDALQRDAHALERSLREAGLRPEEGGLQFTLRRDQGQSEGGQRDRGPVSEARPDLADTSHPEGSGKPLTLLAHRLLDISV